MPQITIVQHGDHADFDRKDDQICSTKNASPHCPNERTIQNEEEKRYKRKVTERGRKTKGNDSLCLTDEETGEDSEQSSLCDQDSDVSFQEDEDEEIDNCEAEEDCIEFIKRSADEAQEHMRKADTQSMRLFGLCNDHAMCSDRAEDMHRADANRLCQKNEGKKSHNETCLQDPQSCA